MQNRCIGDHSLSGSVVFCFCLPKMSDSVHRVLLSLLPFTTSVFDPQKQN